MNTTIQIQNLKCGGCANTITKKLSSLDDVSQILVNNETSTVTFDYENESTIAKVKAVLVDIGYPEVGDKNALTTKAKSFVSCAIGRMNN
ncbi:heavy-metal-associated domain-containing protein [Algibacter luteus]|uniref:Copper chaperone CopZ n=1 Tax=Algibacter luteus TaxID=1178825 RepID=A0A1M6FY97_9FLAO|nr:heavy metal-associated domain-containing protein [Algibacter luteus]SHJ02681.1 Copper chaperone CopZ [Algibacter luteus]